MMALPSMWYGQFDILVQQPARGLELVIQWQLH